MRRIAVGLICLALITGAHAREQTVVGSWTIVETKDNFSDAQRVVATTANESSGSGFGVACENGHPFGRIVVLSSKVKLRRDDAFRMLIRIDDGAVTKGIATVLGSQALNFGLSRTTYEKLIQAYRIALRIKTTDSGVVELIFEPKGTTEALKRVVSRCPLSTALDVVPAIYKPGEYLETPAETRLLVAEEIAKQRNTKEDKSQGDAPRIK